MTNSITIRHGEHFCEVLIAKTLFERLRGLLFRPHWKGGMLLPAKSVHTFFMKQTIDVFFLNQKGRVIHAVLNMKPWRVTKIIHQANMVLEVPSGKLGNLKVGQLIEFE